jgi:outer membrane protein OmpA-like peptidoglycan-associated protein
MQRMGVLRRTGLLGLVGLIGLSLLGGCSADKKKADLAAQEAAELRERNATLEQSARDKDARIAELESRQPSTGYDDADTAPAGRRSSGSGDIIQRDRETGLLGAVIAGDVLFASGSDAIKSEAKKTLDRVASEIKRNYAGAVIRVEGYTDSDPLVKTKAKWGTNDRLSQARADAVRGYLVSKGVSGSRVEAMGYGSAKPKATKAASRRVEILVIQ